MKHPPFDSPRRTGSLSEKGLEDELGKAFPSLRLHQAIQRSPEFQRHLQHCKNPGIGRVDFGRGDIDFLTPSPNPLLEHRLPEGETRRLHFGKEREGTLSLEHDSGSPEQPQKGLVHLGKHYGVSTVAITCTCGENIQTSLYSGGTSGSSVRAEGVNDPFHLRGDPSYLLSLQTGFGEEEQRNLYGTERLPEERQLYGTQERKKKAAPPYHTPFSSRNV